MFLRRVARIVYPVVFCFSFLAAGGCGGAEKPPTGEGIGKSMDGSPDWVRKGCSGYKGEKEGKQICGVGSAGGSRNVSLMRSTAIARARTDMARQLEVGVKGIVRDYQATTTGGDNFGTAVSDEQHVEDTSKQLTDTTLSGTEMVDSWIADDGTFWALVILDVEKFNDAVNKMTNLSEGLRKAVVERAEKAFANLDSEVDKERAAKEGSPPPETK